jgi:hypothetical protein
MNANLTGRPGTTPKVAGLVDAPGIDAGRDRDATAKAPGNDCDISKVCGAFDAGHGRDGNRSSGTWGNGNLGTGGGAGAPMAAIGYKLVSENFTISKMLRRTRTATSCFFAIF